jgi:hypothetical protein
MHTDEQVDETAFIKVSDFALEAVPEPDNRALADQPLSDLGNCRRLVARYGHDLRAIGDTRRRWDGRRWTEDGAKAAALDYCHKTADAIALEAQALDEDVGAAPRRLGLPLPTAFVVLESAGAPVEGDR